MLFFNNRTLNHKLVSKDAPPIKIGIGMDYGRLLMVQAGNSGTRM